MIPNWFVIIMGTGTVFVGLICIVIILKIISALVQKSENKNSEKASAESPGAEVNIPASASTENPDEIKVAAIAAIAEIMGKDIKALRIHSFKKL